MFFTLLREQEARVRNEIAEFKKQGALVGSRLNF